MRFWLVLFAAFILAVVLATSASALPGYCKNHPERAGCKPPPPPPPAQCADGVDNDNDGLVDYPADPGCSSSTDTDETNAPPPPPPACSDGIDNDGDGLVDMADPGCTSSTDNDESNVLPPPSGAPPLRFLYSSDSAVNQSISNGWNLIDSSSKSLADSLPAGVKALYWVGDYDNGTCTWEQSDASITNTVQANVGDTKIWGYLFSDEPDPNACPNAPAQHLARHNLIRSLDPGKQTVIVLDSNSGQASITPLPQWVGKSDVQAIDPYPCRTSAACDFAEMDRQIAAAKAAGLNYWVVAQAFNDSTWRWPTTSELSTILAKIKAENRGGYMVFAWTWAGSTLTDKPELLALLKQFNETGNTDPSPPPAAQCADGVDNDGDGKVDYPADPGCVDAADNDETDPAPPPPSGDPVIAGAGDICWTDQTACEPTALLLDQINPTAVFTLGDNQYNDGTLAEYNTYYKSHWGRHDFHVFPSPGNHDFHTANAQGYRDYYGARAPSLTYSYDLGSWHLISLAGGGVSVSTQNAWLQADLAATTKPCILAYWHEPRFSSGTTHGGSSSYGPLWTSLYNARADVVLNGHEHMYERFGLQTPAGVASADGIREFVVGTGGTMGGYGIGTPVANSEVRNNTTEGVLKLTLHQAGYDFQFVPVAGKTFTDSGTGTCH